MPPKTLREALSKSERSTTTARSQSHDATPYTEGGGTLDPLSFIPPEASHGAPRKSGRSTAKDDRNPRSSTKHPRSQLRTETRTTSEPSTARIHGQAASFSMLDGAHHFSISGNPQFLNVGKQKNVSIYNNYGRPQGLDILQPFVSFDALHDSSAQDPLRRCHPATRKSILKQICHWIDDPAPINRILWLYGPAGTGKSAIAQTISHWYRQGKVAATFLLSKSDPLRSDGNRLFPTLAWQLAISIPGIKDIIADTLDVFPDIPRKAIEVQFERLIAGPLEEILAQGTPTSRPPTKVIVIDGLDECSDCKLQQRILDIVGKAVAKTHLCFLISSRPEPHIADIFSQPEFPAFRINLDNVTDAHHDIRTYLRYHFARIASKQGLEPETWPSTDVIESLVHKSSGHFLYAAMVIKFITHEYSSALSQLDIILKPRPYDSESPFATLDDLYIDVLQRQIPQDFLKDFLVVLVTRSIVSGLSAVDDTLLLNVDKSELHRRLRGMRSLLKVETGLDIAVHHQSFLDFIQDPSRSHKYHISERSRGTRYLKLVVEATIRYASRLIEQPDVHGAEHFIPAFGNVTKLYPRQIPISLSVLEDTLQPLLNLRDKLLQIPRGTKRRFCTVCRIFSIIDDILLHLMFYRGISRPSVSPPGISDVASSQLPITKSTAKATSISFEDYLSPLLTILRTNQSGSSVRNSTMRLLHILLSSNRAWTTLKIPSVSDAQNLVDLIHESINTKNLLSRRGIDLVLHATRLAMEIYTRIPLIPRSLFLNGPDIRLGDGDEPKGEYQGKAVKAWSKADFGINPICQSAFIWGMLSHNNISPLLGICEENSCFWFVYPCTANGTLRDWQQTLKPRLRDIQDRMLEIAKAIEYMHSLGIVLDYRITPERVLIDSNFHAKIPGSGLLVQYRDDRPWNTYSNLIATYKGNVQAFGYLLYEVYFGMKGSDGRAIPDNPEGPKMGDTTWKLIERCCAANPTNRPSMDEVVAEMESWILSPVEEWECWKITCKIL